MSHILNGQDVDAGNPLQVQEKQSEYLGGTHVDGTGASAAVTVPEGATSALIHAEGKPVYWEINPAGDASADSPGYVAADQTGFIPSISNLTTLKVYIAATGKAHIEFYKD